MAAAKGTGKDERPRRVDVGFSGGQVLSLRTTLPEFDALCKALAARGAERWHELTTEDSEVLVDLEQVVYARIASEEHRVGFSG